MEKDDERPYGYIYVATNTVNGKAYIGQTTSGCWKDNQNPIEGRWKKEVGEAFRKLNRGEDLRYVEKAITKYGSEIFEVVEQDTAYSQTELDQKETYWIKEHDSMNPEKGYNLKEGGLGGRLSDQARENLSNVIANKYQTDSDYYDKQAKERKERGNNPDFIEKMTEINKTRAKDSQWREKLSAIGKELWQNNEYREKQLKERRERSKNPDFTKKMTETNEKRAEDTEFVKKMAEINQEMARNPETREKMSNSLSEKWQDPEYRERVSEAVSNKWQEPEYRERQIRAKTEDKREIPDKMNFLEEIKKLKKKDLIKKYDMDGKCINRRIRAMLSHQGVTNYSEAKKYLEDKNPKDVLKDINEKLSK